MRADVLVLALISVAGSLVYAGVVLALHFLPTRYDLVHNAVSDHGVGQYAPLFRVSLRAGSIAVLALAIGLTLEPGAQPLLTRGLAGGPAAQPGAVTWTLSSIRSYSARASGSPSGTMYPADTPASGQNRRRTVRRSTALGVSRRPPGEAVHVRATWRSVMNCSSCTGRPPTDTNSSRSISTRSASPCSIDSSASGSVAVAVLTASENPPPDPGAIHHNRSRSAGSGAS